ncbi:MAG: hypothetical protein AAGG50_07205 [Bacteroidota bacterium]
MSDALGKARSIYHECAQKQTYDEGIHALGALIAEGVEAGEVFQLRASLHAIVGDVSQAKRDLDTAIEIRPKSGGLYYDRGVVHHRMK